MRRISGLRLSFFFSVTVHRRENIHGRVFDMLRGKNILDLNNPGLSHREISAEAQVSLSSINKILKEYYQNNFPKP